MPLVVTNLREHFTFYIKISVKTSLVAILTSIEAVILVYVVCEGTLMIESGAIPRTGSGVTLEDYVCCSRLTV